MSQAHINTNDVNPAEFSSPMQASGTSHDHHAKDRQSTAGPPGFSQVSPAMLQRLGRQQVQPAATDAATDVQPSGIHEQRQPG